MWSFACILAELYTGYPLFPGENEQEQIGYFMEVIGVPEIDLLRTGGRAHLFFDRTGDPKPYTNSRGKTRMPDTKRLDKILGCTDKKFVDLLLRCFVWDPELRITPQEVCRHEWILEGLAPNILIHHMNLHQIEDEELPPNILFNLKRYKEERIRNGENIVDETP